MGPPFPALQPHPPPTITWATTTTTTMALTLTPTDLSTGLTLTTGSVHGVHSVHLGLTWTDLTTDLTGVWATRLAVSGAASGITVETDVGAQKNQTSNHNPPLILSPV